MLQSMWDNICHIEISQDMSFTTFWNNLHDSPVQFFSKNFTHTNTWTFTVFILKWVILQILIFTYDVLLNFVTVCFPTVCKNPTYTVNWNKWEHHTPWRYLEWDLVWRSVLTYMYLSLFRTNTNRWIILYSKV